jgi:hypothetical protein
MKIKSLLIALISGFAVLAPIAAQPVVTLHTDKQSYKVGDIVTLAATIDNNTGLHSIFFDIPFRGDLLAFQGLEQGYFVNNGYIDGKLLYAVSDPVTATQNGNHLIVSYAVNGQGTETSNEGLIFYARFQVTGTGASGTGIDFRFTNHDLIDKNGQSVTGVKWVSTASLSLESSGQQGFVRIADPRHNSVTDQKSAPFSILSSMGSGYSIVLENTNKKYRSTKINAESGILTDIVVPLVPGPNKVSAYLYNSKDVIVAVDSITVFQADLFENMEIISPLDHSLVNSDSVYVKVKSRFNGVEIVGAEKAPESLGEMDQGLSVYGTRVWLHQGFNTIEARVKDPDTNAQFIDTIIIYYQREDGIFRFLDPAEGSVFKPSQFLEIHGELGSRFNSDRTQINTVSIDIVYKPENPALQSRHMVAAVPADIVESEETGLSSAGAYQFFIDPIPLSELSSGTLEISAYKNRIGSKWDDCITRIVTIDSSELRIEINQPNVYSSDVIDSDWQLPFFSRTQTSELSGLQFSDSGKLELVKTKTRFFKETGLSGKKVIDIVERNDGTLYALVNLDQSIQILYRERGGSLWKSLLVRNDLYGYDLCDSPIGVLVGVSHLKSNGETGLYLLNHDLQYNKLSFNNININEPIPYVQFVEKRNDRIFLYGNNYSHLYTFDLYSLSSVGQSGAFLAGQVSATSFSNDFLIKQFELSEDGFTAVIRDAQDNIHFYQNRGGSFIPYQFETPRLKESWPILVKGQYDNGQYITWLMASQDFKNLVVVMEQVSTHRLYFTPVTNFTMRDDLSLIGVGFRDENFFYMDSDREGNIQLHTTQIFFNQLVEEPGSTIAVDLNENGKSVPVPSPTNQLLMTRFGQIYTGFGATTQKTPVFYSMVIEYPAEGNATLEYYNPDIIGISGFSFNVDPYWATTDSIKLAFACKSSLDDSTRFESGDLVDGLVDLGDFVSLDNDYFSVKSWYDAERGRIVFNIEYTTLQKDSWVDLRVVMTPQAGGTPDIAALTINKKIPVLVPRSENGVPLLLPVRGRISDPSVKSVSVGSVVFSVNTDKTFSGVVSLDTDRDEIPVTISCSNIFNQTVTENFIVRIVPSLVYLQDSAVKNTDGVQYFIDGVDSETTDKEMIFVSGFFAGMTGCIVGYELLSTEAGTPVVLSAGLFDPSFDLLPDDRFGDLPAGYVTGKFNLDGSQPVQLKPGAQKLIVYVENPGGKRAVCEINGKIPEITYDMPLDKQRIIFNDTKIVESGTTRIVNNVEISRNLGGFVINETKSSPYQFTRDYTLTGEVYTLNTIETLRVKSLSPDVVFPDTGTAETIISVDSNHRFSVTFRVTMPENQESRDYDLLFIPVAPHLSFLSTGITIKAEKSYEDANLIPDFSLMDESNWTAQQLTDKQKPLRLRIRDGRYLPVNTRLEIVVNYTNVITGRIVDTGMSGPVYKLVDDDNAEINLNGVRSGRNRIQWKLLSKNNYVISSSLSGRTGMGDHLFFLTLDENNNSETSVVFDLVPGTFYNLGSEPLPALSISRNSGSLEAQVVLNDVVIWKSKKTDTAFTEDFLSRTLVQGMNNVTVRCKDPGAQEKQYHFSFLVDTDAPEVSFSSVVYDNQESYIDTVSVLVREANIGSVALEWTSHINNPYTMKYLGGDRYLLVWENLDLDETQIINPGEAQPLRVTITDKTGTSTVANFTGIIPVNHADNGINFGLIPLSGVPVDYYKPYTNPDTPTLLRDPVFTHDPGDTPFGLSRRLKFYHRNIRYTGSGSSPSVSSVPVYVQRPGEVSLGNTQTINGSLHVMAGESVKIYPGFSVNLNPEQDFKVSVHPGLITDSETFFFKQPGATRPDLSNQLSIAFWFRLENNSQYLNYGYDPDNPGQQVLKNTDYWYTLFTFSSQEVKDEENPTEIIGYTTWSLVYKDNSYGNLKTGKTLVLRRTQVNTDGSATIIDDQSPIALDDMRGDGWNLAIISLDSFGTGHGGVLRFTVNNSVTQYVDFSEDETFKEAFFSKDTEYYFGNRRVRPEDDLDNGNFSIAQPLIADQVIDVDTYETLVSGFNTATTNQVNLGETPRRQYSFGSALDNTGSEYYNLRIIGWTAQGPKPITITSEKTSDYFEDQENSNYSETSNTNNFPGSLIATIGHGNHFKKRFDDGILVLLDSTKPQLTNLEVRQNVDYSNTLTLNLKIQGKKGRYTFCDIESGNQLKKSPYYSITGEIFPLYAVSGNPESLIDVKAEIVVQMRFQGISTPVEVRYALGLGAFHYLVHNPYPSLAPQSVIIYLETENNLCLGQNLGLSEGSFELPPEAADWNGSPDSGFVKDGMNLSMASTRYFFGREGSLSFWYKPFTADNEGFVRQNLVLFDSDFITLTGESNSDDPAMFKATLKGLPVFTPVELVSSVPVREGWQYIELTWSHDNRCAYLYINGALAASVQNTTLPLSKYMANAEQLVSDNVFIGSNVACSMAAEGYLDAVEFYPFFRSTTFTDNNPLSFSFSPSVLNDDFTITKKSPELAVSGIRYRMTTPDRVYDKVTEPLGPENHGFTDDELISGAYNLKYRMTVGHYRYSGNFSFIKDDKPRFLIAQNTPFILEGVPTDIDFSFILDNSFVQTSTDGKFQCLALRLKGTSTLDGEISRTVLVYKNPDITAVDPWLTTLTGSEGIEVDIDGNTISLKFTDIVTDDFLSFDMRSVYWNDINVTGVTVNSFDSLEPDRAGTISLASMNFVPGTIGTREYKLGVQVGAKGGEGSGISNAELFNRLKVHYTIKRRDGNNEIVKDDYATLSSNGYVEFFYDDMFGSDYADYRFIAQLELDGQSTDSDEFPISWSQPENNAETAVSKVLTINDFSILNIDSKSKTCRLYLGYFASEVETLKAVVTVIPVVSGGYGTRYMSEALSIIPGNPFQIISNIPIPDGDSIISVELFEVVDNVRSAYSRTAEISVKNIQEAPVVHFTNKVESLITYNNVSFTWMGYVRGETNTDIQYSYNLDNKGWSSFSKVNRAVDFFNLEEGDHSFKVKAKFNGVESTIASCSFFVDINKPQIDTTKIRYYPQYDSSGFMKSVTVVADKGAFTDTSLNALSVNGIVTAYDGSAALTVKDIPITIDGSNNIDFTASDRVGNQTFWRMVVENPLTRIKFPDAGGKGYYLPMTIMGELDSRITDNVEIFLCDPTCANSENFSSWKKATINKDRVFFIEDVYLHPGTKVRTASTDLILAVRSSTGLIFTKTIHVESNTLIRPLTMELDTHAVQGSTAETEVTITCKAFVPGVSTWSIDFNGDGIYDEISTVDNPKPVFGSGVDNRSEFVESTKVWTHKYSSLGLIKPRVRIITTNNVYFSVNEELIIHERITEASNKLVGNPVGMDIVTGTDGSIKVFVLAGVEGSFRIETYEIGHTVNYLSEHLETISVARFGIVNPVSLLVLDESTLLIASNSAGMGHVDVITVNEYGNYIINQDLGFSVYGSITGLTADRQRLYLTTDTDNLITTVELTNGLPDPDSLHRIDTKVPYSDPVGGSPYINAESGEIFIADTVNFRILRMVRRQMSTDQSNPDSEVIYQAEEKFGKFGKGESCFVSPSMITAKENRLFVYDAVRKDIQVFGSKYNLLTNLGYDSTAGIQNYMEEGFLNDLVSLKVFTRDEGGRIYYYALLLSRSKGKLAIFRLPQWDELRAKTRNNRLVFLKDREAFIARPSGSDLMKILSSDSLPRIAGSIDYPALSPDGHRMVFTSKKVLYGSIGDAATGTSGTTQSQLYTMMTDGTGLRRLPLGALQNYDIERPVFSSNGDKLIFSARTASGLWQIYVYNLANFTVSQLFSSDENARFPYYSPDDRFVVFTTDYEGTEEIEIVDTKNTSIRISVTANTVRDSFPVWSTLYPFEITNKDLKIESKIAFVSERGFEKALWYVYLARPTASELKIVTLNGESVGSNPDSAAIRVSPAGTEGEYPCFTGDGSSIVYENVVDTVGVIKIHDFKSGQDSLVSLPEKSTRPSGMKNMISGFSVEPFNGNEVRLQWARYTENEIPYRVRYKIDAEGTLYDEKKVFTQDSAIVSGLEMGMSYQFMVCIVENGEEVAATQWKKIVMPVVFAKPEITIDDENPYMVRLHAWKPDDKTNWLFTWIIDNQEIPVQGSQIHSYEFATSGRKSILLRASDRNGDNTIVSEPVSVTIVSDIKPVVEYVIVQNGGTAYIELDATASLGERIDWGSVLWLISGPGNGQIPVQQGSKVIVPLTGFQNKINVNLRLQRIPVNNQQSTDTLESNMVIDLDYKDVKPVITYEADIQENRLLVFSGGNSLGNIDWRNAQWHIYADGTELHRETGVSSFAFLFAETAQPRRYSVTLSVPRLDNGMTETTSLQIELEAVPLEPVIDYEIVFLKESGNITGAKIIFSAANSVGNNIDFSQAKWTVPVAGSYNDQPTQIGPTAVYNLFGANATTVVEVSLTLTKRGGSDPVTVTKSISLGTVALDTTIFINKTFDQSTTGRVISLDILKSKGPNIDWEKTVWQLTIDGQNRQIYGPVARLEVPFSGEVQILQYTCTVTRFNDTPTVTTGIIPIGKTGINPVITIKKIGGGQNNVYDLSVTDTEGFNIDWERTTWFIYDGNENVVQKYGASITHAFAITSDQMGYPVKVLLYYKGSQKPFVGYTSVDVEGELFIPQITWDTQIEGGDPFVINFSASQSVGSNIEWSSAKWSFGDSSEVQYGAAAVHKYGVDSQKREYVVSLTLSRKSSNGTEEVKTVYKKIVIGSDKVVPKITAEVKNGTLILSAEESEGRGLMLDRSVWLFEGQGDQTSGSESTSSSWSLSASATGGINGGDSGIVATVTVGGSISGQDSNTESLSSSNIHNGAICRKYVGDKKTIRVTLMVYRVNTDGSLVGESLSTLIDLDRVRTKGKTIYPVGAIR